MTTTTPAGTIVVGIDGSAYSDQALDWAARQAALEHRPLTVVHSRQLETVADSVWWGQRGLDWAGIAQQVDQAGRELLDEAQKRAQRHAPDLVIHQVLGTEDARQALLDLAEHAAAVVVGSRGRGAVASLLLGSVSVAVSKHAACPVVVVRHDQEGAQQGGVLVAVDGTAESLPAIEFAYRTASFRSLPLTAQYVFYDVTHRRSEDPVVADDEPGFGEERSVLSESVAGMREKFPDVVDRLVLRRGFRDDQVVASSHGQRLVVVASRQRGLVDDFVHGSIAATVVEHADCDVAVVPCNDATR